MIGFEIDICSKCNLNCEMCDHFANIAKPEVLSVEEYVHDLKRMVYLNGGSDMTITFTGGEPLMHPNLCELLLATWQYAPNAFLQLFTNGILVSNISEELWNILIQHRHQVLIKVSQYSIPINYKNIEEIIRSHGINYSLLRQTDDNWYPMCLDINHHQDPHEPCFYTACVHLQHGRLYKCSRAYTITHWQEHCGQQIFDHLANSIDIHAASLVDIQNYLQRPIDMCKYCVRQKNIVPNQEYRRSLTNKCVQLVKTKE